MLFSPTFFGGSKEVEKRRLPRRPISWRTPQRFFSPPDFRLHGSERRGNGDVRLRDGFLSLFTVQNNEEAAPPGRSVLSAGSSNEALSLFAAPTGQNFPAVFQILENTHRPRFLCFFLFCFVLLRRQQEEKVPSCVYRCEN